MRTLKIKPLKAVVITMLLTSLFGISAYAQQSTTTQQNNNQQHNNQSNTNQNNQQNVNQQGTGQSGNVQHTGANRGFPGDTVTYVINGSDLSFDSKRTLIYDDKHTVDSLVNALANRDDKNYRIIYKKQGQQARQISAKSLRKLDKTGFYKITIAYNRKQLSEDDAPFYILNSK